LVSGSSRHLGLLICHSELSGLLSIGEGSSVLSLRPKLACLIRSSLISQRHLSSNALIGLRGLQHRGLIGLLETQVLTVHARSESTGSTKISKVSLIESRRLLNVLSLTLTHGTRTGHGFSGNSLIAHLQATGSKRLTGCLLGIAKFLWAKLARGRSHLSRTLAEGLRGRRGRSLQSLLVERLTKLSLLNLLRSNVSHVRRHSSVVALSSNLIRGTKESRLHLRSLIALLLNGRSRSKGGSGSTFSLEALLLHHWHSPSRYSLHGGRTTQESSLSLRSGTSHRSLTLSRLEALQGNRLSSRLLRSRTSSGLIALEIYLRGLVNRIGRSLRYADIAKSLCSGDCVLQPTVKVSLATHAPRSLKLSEHLGVGLHKRREVTSALALKGADVCIALETISRFLSLNKLWRNLIENVNDTSLSVYTAKILLLLLKVELRILRTELLLCAQQLLLQRRIGHCVDVIQRCFAGINGSRGGRRGRYGCFHLRKSLECRRIVPSKPISAVLVAPPPNVGQRVGSLVQEPLEAVLAYRAMDIPTIGVFGMPTIIPLRYLNGLSHEEPVLKTKHHSVG
jgi:hypothetical protein